MKNRTYQIVWIFCLLGLVTPLKVLAERIVDVDFKGLETISETVARAQISSIEGSELSRKDLGEDIKKLYRTGYFQDVQVEKNNKAGGVHLVFVVQEKKIVGRLKIEGNKKIKDDDIEAVLQIHEFESYDNAKITQTQAKILGLYEEKGFYLADVEVQTLPFDEETNQVEVIFKIREGKAVKIRRIDFVGNKVFSDKELRKVIRTKEKTMFSFLSGKGELKDESFDIDLKLLAYHYQDQGYLEVKVGSPSLTLTRDKRSLSISIPLSEGKPYKVGSLDVAGDILTTKAELLKGFKQKVGETYRKSLELQDNQLVETIYGNQSYIYVGFEPELNLKPETSEVFITYNIQKNAKIRIRRIVIQGNDITRDKVIRRELRVYENSYINQSAVDLSRTRLLQTGYFKEINFSTPNTSEPNEVDLVIEVVENNTGSFNVSGGFSTLESFIFTASARKDNFMGRGVGASASFSISKLQQNFQVSYRDNYFMDSRWSLGVSAFRLLSSINPAYDQNQFGGNVAFGRELFDFFRTEVEYSFNDVSVNNFSSQVPAFFKNNADGVMSAVGTTFSYDRRDNRLMPKKGTYTAFNVNYGAGFLGTDSPFTKTTLDNRFYVPLPLKMTFRGRQLFGFVNSTTSDPVQLTNRFFMGGPDTLRGYDWQSVGPYLSLPSSAKGEDSDFSYGGDKLMQFNFEVEIPIYAPAGLYGVTFFDSGNAYSETENYNFKNLRHDYGFGVRWQSPIGPLRFEWGFPLNPINGDNSMVFNFMIGPNF